MAPTHWRPVSLAERESKGKFGFCMMLYVSTVGGFKSFQIHCNGYNVFNIELNCFKMVFRFQMAFNHSNCIITGSHVTNHYLK